MSDSEESSNCLINNKWMWYYLTNDMENAICNICDNFYKLYHIKYMILHTLSSHRNFCNPLREEYPYSITENGVKCDRCYLTCLLSLTPTPCIQYHIEEKHKLNKDIANELKNWVNQQLDIIEKCETCEQFEKLDIFNLMVHLFEVHDVTVPPKFIPKGNTADIPTSSSNQLPTCNTLRTYVDNFCSDLHSDSAVESIEEDVTGNLPDIAPSSSLLSADTAEDLPNVQASWMWYYLRTDMKNAKCNICNHTYKLHYIKL
ncbi:uncharacterized protein LOC114938338 isoform X5 [Nylanderia fulva]|uniref:uncharacterized protein LOC114938338 isoform X5 n=1 Tax=Nylanderia fulva TaxID=613905 RepID=UPI0010FBAEEA|nr:uncharacterized protein LOC114938338 isoform X5 [Nylanderia fulva]